MSSSRRWSAAEDCFRRKRKEVAVQHVVVCQQFAVVGLRFLNVQHDQVVYVLTAPDQLHCSHLLDVGRQADNGLVLFTFIASFKIHKHWAPMSWHVLAFGTGKKQALAVSFSEHQYVTVQCDGCVYSARGRGPRFR